ncbi:5874_t:CDS:2 [Funneliformis geosporum]|uniref:6027_t:CDS:1 n=1 Tax=Funneliformis geosporum TaxID=1117311 RepID=A0A9W4SNB5_9GLOM|nr:5874_t:CDS:2 [Funneliformis geosporum]CAI2174896.1 6027_t:CDS:2 [Funneliformis geosporum]
MSKKGNSTAIIKQRESKELQRLTKNDDMPLYTLECFSYVEWKLIRWLASLKNVENLIYLFIVIWNSVSLQSNEQILLHEFNKETNKMVAAVNELTKLKALDISQKQLQRLTNDHKMYLRQTIFNRLNSFRSTAIQIQNAWKKEESILKEQIKTLKEENKTLKEENLQQQAVLDNVIKVSCDYDDSNNTAKLIADIEELQDMLSDFTMVQGSDFKVNIDVATSLLKKYNCQEEYPSTDADFILGAVLQRCTIATILDELQKHLQNARSDNIDTLESDIVNTTERLIKYTELLRDKRKDSDDISKFTPIKIRQYVYSALGCRGFLDDNPLIKITANKLLIKMNNFRQVMGKETSDELYDLAFSITREVINIFCFRLKTQASELQHKFFQAGQAIDVRLMRGSFGSDEAKNLEVEICAFPCIGVFDGEQKVFTRAQVIARTKRRNSDEFI